MFAAMELSLLIRFYEFYEIVEMPACRVVIIIGGFVTYILHTASEQ